MNNQQANQRTQADFTLEQPRQRAASVCAACWEAKGQDLKVLDVSKVFSLSDYFVIASGRSDRQVQGISNRILSTMLDQKIKPLAVEGLDKGHWVLIDFGSVIVHVFYAPMRERYDLESLWDSARLVDVAEELGVEELGGAFREDSDFVRQS